MSEQDTTDVIIIGAGFAGCCAAWVLTSQGISVRMIERTRRYPEAFRAEKIEPDQAENLRKFGMLDMRLPFAGPLGKTINHRGGISREFDTVEQYGMHYTDTVNSFREHLEGRCETVIGRATEIINSDDLQTVKTEDGEYSARVVIVAAGGKDNLLNPLGIHRRTQDSLTSMSFAFHVEPDDISRFDFSGFNYFLDEPVDDIDYVTIFRIGDIMRVNLFSQMSTKSPVLRAIKKSPREQMQKYFPDLEDLVGGYTVTTKVQSYPTNFYRLRGTDVPGVVIIGDDYQSVNPTTGTGISKCTTDADRLCNHYIPQWLKTPGMSADKIRDYYRDEVKRAVDANSLELWISYRDQHRGFWGNKLSSLELRFNNLFDRW